MSTQQEHHDTFWACLTWVVICLVMSGLAGWVSATHVNTWYTTLIKPSFNPPKEIFAPVWTTLYIMIGIAGGLIWRQRQQYPWLLRVFIVQLILNFAWSFIFFAGQNVFYAMIDIIALWLCITVCLLFALKANKLIALLLTPYWLWVGFAMVLNVSLFQLNY